MRRLLTNSKVKLEPFGEPGALWLYAAGVVCIALTVAASFGQRDYVPFLLLMFSFVACGFAVLRWRLHVILAICWCLQWVVLWWIGPGWPFLCTKAACIMVVYIFIRLKRAWLNQEPDLALLLAANLIAGLVGSA